MDNNGEDKERVAVWYNRDMIELHKQIQTEGLTSQSLSDFARNAFHDKVDALRFKAMKEVQA
jgi:hypothetical protein